MKLFAITDGTATRKIRKVKVPYNARKKKETSQYSAVADGIATRCV